MASSSGRPSHRRIRQLRGMSETSVSSIAFAEGTRLEVKFLCGNRCWNCGGDPPDVCHIVAKEDRTVCP